MNLCWHFTYSRLWKSLRRQNEVKWNFDRPTALLLIYKHSFVLVFLSVLNFFFFSRVCSIKVFLYGVVFCSHCQLQRTAKINAGVNQSQQPLFEPRCLPLPLLRLLTTDRQREWWDAIYSLIHKRAAWVLVLSRAKWKNIQNYGISKRDVIGYVVFT